MVVGTQTTLHASVDIVVLDVRCECPARHVDEEDIPGVEVVLPVSGVYRRRTAAGTAVVDASVAYAGRPGAAQRIEHVSDGDRCIVVRLTSRLADELAVDRAAWDRSSLRRDRRVDRAVVTARRAVEEEAWLTMLAALLRDDTSRPSSRAHHQHTRAVDIVREAVAADPGGAWTMRSLSQLAGYAPHHLSRVFRQATGLTVSEHRDRVRLARAAELAADGMRLADVAASVGFVDHGHLTRRARRVLGVVPSALRPARVRAEPTS